MRKEALALFIPAVTALAWLAAIPPHLGAG